MEISASLTSVAGEKQGIPKLALFLSVEGRINDPMLITSVTAAVQVTKGMTLPESSNGYFIGMGFLESSAIQLSRNSKTIWKIGIPLSPAQLQKIEQMRNGRDLFLNVRFFCTAGIRVTPPSGAAGLPPHIDNIFSPSVGVDGLSDGSCPFKVAQSDWEKTLKDLGGSELSEAEAQIRQASERAKEKLREVQDVAAKVKETASITAVAQHAIYFKQEADEHRKGSYYWLAGAIILAVAAACYSVRSFGLAMAQGIQSSNLWWPHVAYLTSRLIVLSVIFFGMGWCAKHYRAQRHNEVVNRHRQNALRTFETFAVAATEPATKDAVLLAATKSIFEPQSSGYLTGESEKVPSSTVIEILKSAISKGEQT